MRILIVYTPFAWPSAPPLGISILKSYLQKIFPESSVSAIDLNLDFFMAPGRFAFGLCECCDRMPGVDCVPPGMFLHGDIYEDARKTFSSKTAFYDIHRHARDYVFFRTFYEHLSACIKRVFRGYIENRNDNAKLTESIISIHGDMLLDFAPDVIGFSAHADQAAYALALSKYVKSKKQSVKTVIGGYFPSFCGAKDILDTFDYVDYAVEGEGEEPLAAIIESLQTGTGVRCDFPGTAERGGGEVSFAAPGKGPRVLDSLPFPDFSDYKLDDYFVPETVLPILASRGCSWGKCAFCAHRENYCANYRQRSADNVAVEMKYQKAETGARHFLFCDEQIGGHRLDELSRALSSVDASFGLAGLKPDRNVTYDRLEKAAKAGLVWVYLGVETLSPRLLELMDKGTTVEDVLRVIKCCDETGIVPFVSYIWGFPSQTKEEVVSERATIRENKHCLTLPDDGHYFSLEKNSPIFKNSDKFCINPEGAEVMFDVDGKKILSGRYRFSVSKGLTPYQSKNIFGPPEDFPYETHSFWEALILLAARGKRLVFDRKRFHENILDSVWERIAEVIDDSADSNDETELMRAHCMFKMQTYERVIAELGKNIKASDKFRLQKIFLLGKSCMAIEEYDRAIECFSSVAGAAEKNDTIYQESILNMALCLERAGDIENAKSHYGALIKIKPLHVSRAECLAGLGRCCFRMGEWDDAIASLLLSREEDLEGRLELDLCFHLITCYEMTDNPEKASEESRRLAELMP